MSLLLVKVNVLRFVIVSELCSVKNPQILSICLRFGRQNVNTQILSNGNSCTARTLAELVFPLAELGLTRVSAATVTLAYKALSCLVVLVSFVTSFRESNSR